MTADAEIPLIDRLKEDARDALRAGDKARLGVLRMALAAVQQREVDSRETLDDAGVRSVIEKMVKQRHEAAEQFRKGERSDLVAKENAEITVLQGYLPEPMSDEETAQLVEEVIAALGASTPGDMGRVMGEIKQRGGGRVDLGKIAGAVRSRLQSP